MGFLGLQLVSKYGKNERGPFRDIENFFEEKTKIEKFEQCHSAENVKGGKGDPRVFLTSILLQIEGSFGVIQKFSKNVS